MLKAFGGDFDDFIKGNDGKDIVVGDFAFYNTSAAMGYPEVLRSINCDVGGADTLLGGDGEMDYIVAGRFNDTVFADDSSSTNSANSDVVFGDHGEIMFYDDESHKLQQAITTDVDCDSGGSDVITLGPGNDLVSW